MHANADRMQLALQLASRMAFEHNHAPGLLKPPSYPPPVPLHVQSAVPLDGSQSLLVFEGGLRVHGLFDFLLNESFRSHGDECDVPTLLAPVHFQHACLKAAQPKVCVAEGERAGAGGLQLPRHSAICLWPPGSACANFTNCTRLPDPIRFAATVRAGAGAGGCTRPRARAAPAGAARCRAAALGAGPPDPPAGRHAGAAAAEVL